MSDHSPQKLKRLVIFGTGSFAEVAYDLFTRDSQYAVVAFTAHRDQIDRASLLGVPIVPFEDLQTTHPPATHEMFVAVGYREVNALRRRLYQEAKDQGYSLATYISSHATYLGSEIGDNCFVFEDNTIQSFARIGNNVVLWSGNHIGHHSTIGDDCFLASHIVVSGHCQVGSRTFIGVNATLRDNIRIGRANVIGAGALIMKDTEDHAVFIAPRTMPDERTSDRLVM